MLLRHLKRIPGIINAKSLCLPFKQATCVSGNRQSSPKDPQVHEGAEFSHPAVFKVPMKIQLLHIQPFRLTRGWHLLSILPLTCFTKIIFFVRSLSVSSLTQIRGPRGEGNTRVGRDGLESHEWRQWSGLWAPSVYERSTGNAELPASLPSFLPGGRVTQFHKAKPKVTCGKTARNFRGRVDFRKLTPTLCNTVRVSWGRRGGRCLCQRMFQRKVSPPSK